MDNGDVVHGSVKMALRDEDIGTNWINLKEHSFASIFNASIIN